MSICSVAENQISQALPELVLTATRTAKTWMYLSQQEVSRILLTLMEFRYLTRELM